MCGHGGMCAPPPQKIMFNVNQTDKGKLVHPTKKLPPPPSIGKSILAMPLHDNMKGNILKHRDSFGKEN